jgi:hypothetical protein
MAGITRTIHPQSSVRYAPISQIAPDVQMRANVTPENGAGEEVQALAFIDPDGETHIYPLSEEGKQALLKQLTGGIVVPGLKQV